MLTLTLPFTATRVHAATYLLGVCLFSISFLVFLNSAVSFVITDRIGQKKRVGDAVGTLGFADEIVALVACPVWGMLSDRVGVRTVTVCGYAIAGVSLVIFVQAKNVYPQLLLGRLFFSLGGAATSTMVTAILPSMTHKRTSPLVPTIRRAVNGTSHVNAPSISSELTITPARFRSRTPSEHEEPPSPDSKASASQLAGIVGMFTGFGALVALGFFLRLPTRFQNGGASPSQAIADSFYVVGSVAVVVAIACFLGLRGLPGEEEKGLQRLFGTRWPRKRNPQGESGREPPVLPPYSKLLSTSLLLGFRDVNIGLGYIGGFVARASSVGISLFIPLFVNAYFISSGRCPSDPDHSTLDPGDIKQNCKRAYIVASILAGVSQLVALICAPIFGYLSSIYTRYNIPLLLASAAGIAGYATFGMLKSPDPRSEDGSIGVFFIVALLGISQIGAIVCSLGLLARGIETEDEAYPLLIPNFNGTPASGEPLEESAPLLPSHFRSIKGGSSRNALKGSIAGVYSLAGGAGILLLTKVGGLLFDKWDTGSPFFMMAIFNAVLFATILACNFWEAGKSDKKALQFEGNVRDDG